MSAESQHLLLDLLDEKCALIYGNYSDKTIEYYPISPFSSFQENQIVEQIDHEVIDLLSELGDECGALNFVLLIEHKENRWQIKEYAYSSPDGKALAESSTIVWK